MPRTGWIAILAAAVILAACGGGDDAGRDEATSTTPPTTAASTPPGDATAAAAASDRAVTDLARREAITAGEISIVGTRPWAWDVSDGFDCETEGRPAGADDANGWVMTLETPRGVFEYRSGPGDELVLCREPAILPDERGPDAAPGTAGRPATGEREP